MPGLSVFIIRSDSPNWHGLRLELDAMEGVAVVGDTASGAEAREQIPVIRPGVILTASVIDGSSVAPLLRDLRSQVPDAVIAIVSGRHNIEELVALATLGVSGYLLWDDIDHPTYAYACQALLGGAFFVCSRQVGEAFIRGVLYAPDSMMAALAVTDTEREVLVALTAGESDKEIASRLHLSRRTVEDYVRRLSARFAARNRTNLVAIAVGRKVVSPPDGPAAP